MLILFLLWFVCVCFLLFVVVVVVCCSYNGDQVHGLFGVEKFGTELFSSLFLVEKDEGVDYVKKSSLPTVVRS